MEKTLEAVRLELGDYFGNGTNFYDWEKEFGILNTSITRTEEEAVAYYKNAIDWGSWNFTKSFYNACKK